nr:hypothetical protein [Macrococcus caseolyticus]
MVIKLSIIKTIHEAIVKTTDFRIMADNNIKVGSVSKNVLIFNQFI